MIGNKAETCFSFRIKTFLANMKAKKDKKKFSPLNMASLTSGEQQQ